jgi:hypothetical protein
VKVKSSGESGANDANTNGFCHTLSWGRRGCGVQGCCSSFFVAGVMKLTT